MILAGYTRSAPPEPRRPLVAYRYVDGTWVPEATAPTITVDCTEENRP